MTELGFGIRSDLLQKPKNRYILNLLHLHAKKLGIYEGWPRLNNIGVGSFVSRLLASAITTVKRFNAWHHAFAAEAVANSIDSPG